MSYKFSSEEYTFSEPFTGKEEELYTFSEPFTGKEEEPYTFSEPFTGKEEEPYTFSEPFTGKEEELYTFSEPFTGEEESYFENFPVEDIYAICQQLDNESLAAISRTSTRNWRICHSILNKRRLAQMEKDITTREQIVYPWIDQVFDHIYKTEILDNSISRISEILYQENKEIQKSIMSKCVKILTERYIKIHNSLKSDWLIIALAILSLLWGISTQEFQNVENWLSYHEIFPAQSDYMTSVEKFNKIRDRILKMKDLDKICNINRDNLLSYKKFLKSWKRL